MKKRILLALAVILCFCSLCLITVSAEAAPKTDIVAHNLALENSVNIVYYVDFQNVPTGAEKGVLIWTSVRDEYVYGTESAKLTNIRDTISVYSGYVFTGVAAKMMSQDIYAKAYIKNGNTVTYSELDKYSVLQYAFNKKGSTSIVGEGGTTLGELVAGLLDYGTLAQTYFRYNLDRLANADYYQVNAVNGALTDGTKSGLYQAGAQVMLNAPAEKDGIPFSCWKDETGETVGTGTSVTVTVGTKNKTYTATYLKTSTGLEFESNEDGTCALISIGDCTDTDVIIPSRSPDGDLVTSIDSSAFSGKAITSITIPVGIEEIGRNAFKNCDDLTDVYYEGTTAQWEEIDIKSGNAPLTNATLHTNDVFYTVTFVDYDGRVIKSEQVAEGGNATAPSDPERAGYTFYGWSESYKNITANVTVTATYTKNSSETYTVIFYDYDGTTILKSQQVSSGANAAPPSNPSKAGASFLGWNGNYTNVEKNETLRAVYSDEKNVMIVESASGAVGSNVTVLISIDGIVKTCGFDINILYDPNLELISYDDDMDLDIVVNSDAFENGMKLNFSSASDKTRQRDIIELTFRIKNTAKTLLPVSISVNSIKEINANNPADTTSTIVNGVIAVN